MIILQKPKHTVRCQSGTNLAKSTTLARARLTQPCTESYVRANKPRFMLGKIAMRPKFNQIFLYPPRFIIFNAIIINLN